MDSLIIKHTEPKLEIDIIAAQCPTKETIPDFYKMLDKYKIRRIIMVTGLVEKKNGKNIEKCNDYFTKIQQSKEHENKDWGEIRTLDLKKLEETN